MLIDINKVIEKLEFQVYQMQEVRIMFKIRLKELRESKKISQAKFAKELGISQGSVGNWESGIREPNFQMIEKIADYFDVPIDYLLGHGIFRYSDKILASKQDIIHYFEKKYAIFKEIDLSKLNDIDFLRIMDLLIAKKRWTSKPQGPTSRIRFKIQTIKRFK